MKKIRILHIIKDDKFFDDMVSCFETKPIYQSSYILETSSKKYVFKYIKKTDKITILWNKKQIQERLFRDDYDVVFFFSIPTSFYKYFKFIGSNKIIIWWAWGYDLYSPLYGTSPFLDIELFKPLTKKKYYTLERRGIDFIKRILRKNILKQRKEWIKRIDYFNPVLHLEYELMKDIPGFRAKEYHYPFSIAVNQNINRGEDILIGNSASYENNHLDVWNELSSFIPQGRTVVIPLSYGDEKYAKMVKKDLQSDNIDLHFIMNFMPKDEYFELISKCSYAVFGILRQMAMGNIYYCLQTGVKVFLYKDSIVFKHLKMMGYIVFTIEEIDKSSFVVPLTHEEIVKNKNAFVAEQKSKQLLEQKFEIDFLNQV